MSYLKDLFKPAQMILCPYCMAGIKFRKEFNKCPSCNRELPVRYRQDYNEAPPFFVQLVGWSRVGKTVYLQALTLMLMRMTLYWKNHFNFAPLTQETLEYVRNVHEFLNTGVMPPPTQLEIQQAYMMILKGMERWGGRTIVTRDVAGEYFNELEWPIQYTPYLMNVPVTLLMVSMQDIETQAAKTMDQLMMGFIQTLARNDRDYRKKNRKLVVILSKADLIYARLPQEIQNYLMNDPLAQTLSQEQVYGQSWDVASMESYMLEMKRVSGQLCDWISGYYAGRNLNNLAHDAQFQLEFTIVSSTGASVINDRLPVNMQPRRVLDPYFWALDFQSEP